MPIDLGLSRISSLLASLGNPQRSSFKSVHIAGTNGKGSALAYLSSVLTEARVRNGRFTSPHIISYNDCVCINNQEYPLHKFENVKAQVEDLNETYRLECTEFEILTATAFKIFELEKVELALIEVGLGGLLDATNVLKPLKNGCNQAGVAVTGITKIGMDHELMLGNSLSAIAKAKAGIIKRNTPVVIDDTNEPVVQEVIRETAIALKSPFQFVGEKTYPLAKELLQHSSLQGEYQVQNLSVALKILEILRDAHGFQNLDKRTIVKGLQKTLWPGRLQTVREPKAKIDFLLDGAHNEIAALELGKFLRARGKRGRIFVIAISYGKLIENLLRHLVQRESDCVIPFEFTPPAEMPWVRCYSADAISKAAKSYVDNVLELPSPNIESLFGTLREMKIMGDSREIVMCGSLYFCSDVLRHVKTVEECANSPALGSKLQ